MIRMQLCRSGFSNAALLWVSSAQIQTLNRSPAHLLDMAKTELCKKELNVSNVCERAQELQAPNAKREKQAEVKWGRMWSLLRQRSVSKWIWKARYTAEVNIDFSASKNNNEIPFLKKAT